MVGRLCGAPVAIRAELEIRHRFRRQPEQVPDAGLHLGRFRGRQVVVWLEVWHEVHVVARVDQVA